MKPEIKKEIKHEHKEEKKEHKEEKKISPLKKKIVDELAMLIEKHNTVMVASIENMSSAQFQKMKKTLKGKAIVKVVKKNLALMAFEKGKGMKKELEQLEKSISSNFAILFSNEDAFDVAAMLIEKKEKAFVKAGAIAKNDIVLEAGPTDLMAGPVLSELGKIKVKAGIEQGKIAIKERTVVVKKGEKVSGDVADILMKIEVMPVFVYMSPLAALDSKTGKIYENISIDREGTLGNINLCSSQAFNLAIKITYVTESTIKSLLAKANAEFNSLQEKLQIEQAPSPQQPAPAETNAQSENKTEQTQN